MLAFQGPKTLKMLKGPQPAATAADGRADPAAAPAPGTPTGAPRRDGDPPPAPRGARAPPRQPSSPSCAGLRPAARRRATASSLSFERFASKDPFAQQVERRRPPSPVDGDRRPDPTAEPTVTPGIDPTIPAARESAAPTGRHAGSAGSTGASGPAPAELDRAAPADGDDDRRQRRRRDVVVEARRSRPTSRRSSSSRSRKDGKSVQIGVAGGSLAGGGETVKLELGKQLTLQNTADGSRYELELLTVEGFAAAQARRA